MFWLLTSLTRMLVLAGAAAEMVCFVLVTERANLANLLKPKSNQFLFKIFSLFLSCRYRFEKRYFLFFKCNIIYSKIHETFVNVFYNIFPKMFYFYFYSNKLSRYILIMQV